MMNACVHHLPSVHNPKSDTAQLKTATMIETCVTCQDEWRSGAVGPHASSGRQDDVRRTHNRSSTNVRMLKIGNYINEACTELPYGEARPFLWDHAPVRRAVTRDARIEQ